MRRRRGGLVTVSVSGWGSLKMILPDVMDPDTCASSKRANTMCPLVIFKAWISSLIGYYKFVRKNA